MSKVAEADLKISRAMPGMAEGIDESIRSIAGKPLGFCLVVFNSEAGSRVNYISNCDRGDVQEVLKKMIKLWDTGMPDIPSHEIN